MVVLSPRYAVLACFCAAIPLAFPPPVEAAHLYGSQSTEKHASSSPATNGYHDKHHERKGPSLRAPELPPLLRRQRVHGHRKTDDHQGQDHHDQSHPKAPRSAFARSRYRRGSTPHSRRSSVYVPGDHGNTYLVTRTPSSNLGNTRKGTDKQSSHAHNRRQVDESGFALGRIDIMGTAQSSGTTQRLASLTVDSTPIDWTSGQSFAKAFQLNASTTNQTQFIMMPTVEPSNAAGGFDKHVTLATEVFDANRAEMVMYCATYDPDPGSTSALLMTPCAGPGTTQSAAPVNDAADPCSDAANDASSSNLHQSQIFSYDPSSGRIQPISATTSASGVDDSSDDPPGCAGARVRRDNGNPTTTGSTSPSSTSTSTAPTTSASQQARNVTLVYVASAVEVPASSPSASYTTNASISPAPLLTTTITTTVVATVTASDRTVTPAKAAVSVSASSVPSQSSTTIMTPSVPATASRSTSSLSLLSSVSATSTSKAPSFAEESLEVEIVGVTPSPTANSSSTSSTTATATSTTTSSSSSVSPSLDAEAVAASIADGMVHRRRRASVMASGNINHL
ncbi:hypothetical protein OG21DRAFT_688164 [Imleria badia]|nr:hypothetical protein OG21DRAFT_688164 [Imleria badia]